MSTTRELARHVHELSAEDLPAPVRRYATVLIADAVGAGVFGSGTEVADIILRSARTRSSAATSAIWGRPERLEAAASALVNGVQAHACELDDYHPGAKCHPGAVVIPAALAAAGRRDVSGSDLLLAVVAGYEVMIRASLAAGANGTRRRGWHITGLVGPFGAATAVARLDGLDLDTFIHALGIAGSHAGGLFAFSSSGAMTKRLHAGRAAEAGVLSSDLARDGFTGPPDVLEAADGGFIGAVSDDADPGRITAGLTDGFALADVAIKPYSCCGSLHSSIDAVIQLASEHDLTPDDIAAITAHNSSVVDQQCGFAYTGTGGLLEAQMSLQYCLAVAAIDRHAFLPQFTPERIAEPTVQDLAQRVRFALDPTIDAEYPRSMPARVTIRTADGSELERSVPGPTGSSFAPWSFDEVRAKFRGITDGRMEPGRAEQVLDLIEGLDEVDDVGRLTRLLTG
jgi:2-methylcitrate dehydratase PrpD